MKPCKTNPHNSLFPSTIDEMFRDFWGDRSRRSQFAPRVDVTETPEAYSIRVDLPGVDPNEVELSVTPDELTISGKREPRSKVEGETIHITERVSGTFSRTFGFPVSVSPDDVTAESKRGVLHIEVKKGVAERARRIEIRGE